jgi:oligoribonuclease
MSEPILWFDMETSGLIPEKHHILEVAAIVTDSELNELDWIVGVPHVQGDLLDEMDEWCTKTHTESGLAAECIESNRTLFDVERDVLTLIDRNWGLSAKPILAGNSIHFDRSFIRRYMQRLDKRLHYRMLDVTAVTEAYRLLFSYGIGRDTRPSNHRAVSDARRSIELMKAVRSQMIWGMPT